jgi:hypothetical protein
VFKELLHLSEFDRTGLLYSGTDDDKDEYGISIPDGFSNLLLITIPESTPTDNYAVTVTAQIGSNTHSMSIIVSVQSAEVTVSGTVDPSYSGITPYQIKFLRIQTVQQLEYYATLTDNAYSITVPNHDKYVVSVSDGYGTWYMCTNDFWLEVPAGSTSMTKDFTVFGE